MLNGLFALAMMSVRVMQHTLAATINFLGIAVDSPHRQKAGQWTIVDGDLQPESANRRRVRKVWCIPADEQTRLPDGPAC